MKRLTAFLLVTLVGWNIVLMILYLQSEEDTTAATATQQTKQKVETTSVNITSDVTELTAKSENKVVTVTVRVRGQTLDTGSGAVYKVDGKTVYITTSNHVVVDRGEAVVTFANDEGQKVDIVGKDGLTDLVLLRTDADFKAEVFVTGNSSFVKEGEYIIAMGSPLGIEYQGSASGDLISGVDKRMEMDIDNDGVTDWDVDILQTDAAINPGNSGGSLVDMTGELIGIDSMKITNTPVEGFGSALPINEVLPIIMELENNGKVIRPILGISIQSIEQLSMLDKAYLGIDSKVESGLLIVRVASRIPAASIGVEEGDIPVKFNGREIKDYKQFRQYLYSHKVKNRVIVVINRSGKEIGKMVILE